MYNEIEFKRKIDEAGINFIKQHEGFSTTAYKDSAGIWTIGYGSTRIHDRHVKSDDVVTEHQAINQMIQDLETFENAVNESVKVYLSQSQYNALVSFTYNVGSHAFKTSTLLKKLNQSDYQTAANEFLKWVHAGGQRIQGLVNRRTDERALFLEDIKQ
ncbi:lysozyme [Halomonas sp. ISL-60]|uniref:lysozyme n=1 Tax=Halomonas sp. ISL-56 TaxID=2819149 RepID=UPI001BE847DD|nr:lysozyme [Halomonas sp. ISL-56]MBT2771327.1 lysozyme [Halomonas sp. ISL-60]MBT2800684.1 lysozyme [Halomonas sp. ISL-56]